MDIMRNDLPKLTEDTGYIFKRVKSKIDTIRRKERKNILLQQSIRDIIDLLQERDEDRAIEIAETISTNTSLASSKGQPSWCPPVPTYAPPMAYHGLQSRSEHSKNKKRKMKALHDKI